MRNGKLSFAHNNTDIVARISSKVYPGPCAIRTCEDIYVSGYMSWGIDDIEATVAIVVVCVWERSYRF